MRFYGQSNDEDHDEEDSDRFFNEDEMDDEMDEEEAFYQDNKEIKLAELDLVHANLNRRILVNVIKMLENSFFWKFLPFKTKLIMIEEAYNTFDKLIGE